MAPRTTFQGISHTSRQDRARRLLRLPRATAGQHIVRLAPVGSISDLLASASPPPPLLLIEHERGIWCGRFRISKGWVPSLPLRRKLALRAFVAFRVPQEARVLGAVDMEIRWIDRFETPVVGTDRTAVWRQPGELRPAAVSFGTLLCQARNKAGLTLREVSLLSEKISHHFKNKQICHRAEHAGTDCRRRTTRRPGTLKR